jgi:hypothetical protein
MLWKTLPYNFLNAIVSLFLHQNMSHHGIQRHRFYANLRLLAQVLYHVPISISQTNQTKHLETRLTRRSCYYSLDCSTLQILSICKCWPALLYIPRCYPIYKSRKVASMLPTFVFLQRDTIIKKKKSRVRWLCVYFTKNK